MMVDIEKARPALQAAYDAMTQVTYASIALAAMAENIPDDGATGWMSKKITADAQSLEQRWGDLMTAIGLDPCTVDFLTKT